MCIRDSHRRGRTRKISFPHALGLKRFHQTRQLHFLTFSCYKRRPNFRTLESRSTFETALERIRQKYGLWVNGCVVMPEHVHLLVGEPERSTLAQAMQALKQGVARRLALRAADSFWQARYYDFNVWSDAQVRGEASLHSSADWLCVPRIGPGAVFVTMRAVRRDRSRSNRSGPSACGSNVGSFPR